MTPFDMPPELTSLGVTLRPMQLPDDMESQYALLVSGRWAEVAPLVDWTDEQKVAFLLEQAARQLDHYLTHYKDGDFGVLVRDDELVGRLFLLRTSHDLRVVDIILAPNWRNRGFGGLILQKVQQEAATTGCKVSIHVEKFNPAQRLYHRLGFVQVKDREVYWLMEWIPDSR